tara:strand:- start:724 stop:1251 length:528 start_codon:yes stop_codon:yes gene_type:complete
MSKLLIALNEFQKLSVSASKGGTNPHFKSEYSTLENVIKAVSQGSQFGLVFTQEVNFTDDMQVFVETSMRHIDCIESIKCKVPVFCKDMTNCHQLGSGITYAKRYGLQSLYGLPSEDDDGNQAKGSGVSGKATNNTPKKIVDNKVNQDIGGDLKQLEKNLKQGKPMGVEELGQSI